MYVDSPSDTAYIRLVQTWEERISQLDKFDFKANKIHMVQTGNPDLGQPTQNQIEG